MTTETPSDRTVLESFLASHGGPFFELQARLHLIHVQALTVRSRGGLRGDRLVRIVFAWAPRQFVSAAW